MENNLIMLLKPAKKIKSKYKYLMCEYNDKCLKKKTGNSTVRFL
jgi:hypothetical protein